MKGVFQILYTLDTDKNRIIYLCISILVLIFSLIYEYFSHGVYSYFMIGAFLVPLIFGAIGGSLLRDISILSINLYHSFIATLTIFCIAKGFLEIYGTTNSLINIYLAVSVILFISTIIFRRRSFNE